MNRQDLITVWIATLVFTLVAHHVATVEGERGALVAHGARADVAQVLEIGVG
jgi:hypothetical protein